MAFPISRVTIGDLTNETVKLVAVSCCWGYVEASQVGHKQGDSARLDDGVDGRHNPSRFTSRASLVIKRQIYG